MRTTAPRSRRACAPRPSPSRCSSTTPRPCRSRASCRSTARACWPAASSPATERSLNTAQVTAGDSVAVIGAGGVGPQLHPGRGARRRRRRSSRSTSRPTGRTVATAFGATHVIDPAAEDAARRVRRADRGPRCRLRPRRGRRDRRGRARPAARATRRHRRDRGHAGLGRDGRDRARRRSRTTASASSAASSARPSPRSTCRDSLASTSTGRLRLDELISSRSPLAAINEALASAARGEALRAVITF